MTQTTDDGPQTTHFKSFLLPENFTISTIAVLLQQYDDIEPPTKPRIYSHPSYVTLLELFYLKIYPFLLINLMIPDKLAPDLRGQGHSRRENTIIA